MIPSSRIERCRYGSFQGPSAGDDAVIKRAEVNPRLLAPFAERNRSTIERKSLSQPFVPSLLKPGCPRDIIWRVVAIRIFSLKGKALLPGGEHIVIEVSEIAPPSFAHFNSFPTIIVPRLVCGALAPSDHIRPFRVETGFNPALSCAVSSRSSPSLLPREAPARDCMACFQAGVYYCLFFATSAPAQPDLESPRTLYPRTGEPNNCKPAEGLTSKVLATKRRGRINFASVHRITFSLDVSAGRKLNLPFSTPIFV